MIITIKDGVQNGQFADRRDYYGQRRSLLGKLVMPFTKRLRTKNVLACMEPRQRHLDIGCGDGFFLQRSPCRELYGLDELYGETFEGSLDFPEQYFDYVTMLAVVEHLDDVGRAFREIKRVLKPDGAFILTTPKQKADGILRLVAKEIEHIHQAYFDRESMAKQAEGLFSLSRYRPFLLGLNQLFYLEPL
jgi:SAM-dependent methyltransferase